MLRLKLSEDVQVWATPVLPSVGEGQICLSSEGTVVFLGRLPQCHQEHRIEKKRRRHTTRSPPRAYRVTSTLILTLSPTSIPTLAHRGRKNPPGPDRAKQKGEGQDSNSGKRGIEIHREHFRHMGRGMTLIDTGRAIVYLRGFKI